MQFHADGAGGTAPDEYLVRAGYALGADDGSIADARNHAAALLDRARDDHQLPMPGRTTDLGQLVVSELVTNARTYAPGPVLTELRVTVEAVEVVVWDSSPTLPAAKAADPSRIGQHGLELVKAVTEDLSTDREPVGKRITARITLSDASGTAA
ncbi:ATP-binding protein [Streptomyces ruber]|uniref:ATP-binding protein n=2 Tax=Streptomyces TaxID=1883 RepID=A0A918BTD9_9ACTN|nr:ATP-binding protein [Streptomyces ruber]GGQ88519.1 ATP-binding protein [Streptomyces ruber]